MWVFQIAVGIGLVALGLWARGRGGRGAESSRWWIPLLLGLASLSISAVQRLRPEWEGEVLLAAFFGIGILVVYIGALHWRGRA